MMGMRGLQGSRPTQPNFRERGSDIHPQFNLTNKLYAYILAKIE